MPHQPHLVRATLLAMPWLASVHLFAACASKEATAVDGGPRAGAGGSAATGGKGSAAGAPGSGGKTGSAGLSDSGGVTASGGSTGGTLSAGAGGAAVTQYSLTVDAPSDGAGVQGLVTVRGVALGYQNVEVWDATHTMPPLAASVPSATGAFSMTVDTSALPSGATMWTVWAWIARRVSHSITLKT